MDSLKDLINSKKSDLKQKLNNKSWISQNELKKYEIKEYINRQKERDLRKVLKKEVKHSKFNDYECFLDSKIDLKEGGIHDSRSINEATNNGKNYSLENVFENKVDDNGISVNEIVKRLRFLGEPIILFGESYEQRYERLLALEIQGRTKEEINIGQKNIFTYEFDSNISLYSVNDTDKTEIDFVDIKQEDGECNEKFVLRWIENQICEWERILKHRSKKDAETEKGKYDSAQYYQTKRDIQPLISSLRNMDGKVDGEVLEKLYEIVILCCDREYIKAQDKYIELAIGNAPWPMGVTMVGIHERAGRTKIFSSHIAHVLNDETTRKYIQMFKRLMTHCELRRPQFLDK
ncbi:hypothetical protein FG386_001105 [Cryptosporidium ryanae]|uniref:uncharacterized protein n=1 Tax=Cryptosporidium ryanae TaxID=515981 RepID=UPI00351A42F0|nr:hypothetical protein FG386_001105 [Cryptosporidium ryanae]